MEMEYVLLKLCVKELRFEIYFFSNSLTYFMKLVSYSICFRDTFHAKYLSLYVISTRDCIRDSGNGLLMDLEREGEVIKTPQLLFISLHLFLGKLSHQSQIM